MCNSRTSVKQQSTRSIVSNILCVCSCSKPSYNLLVLSHSCRYEWEVGLPFRLLVFSKQQSLLLPLIFERAKDLSTRWRRVSRLLSSCSLLCIFYWRSFFYRLTYLVLLMHPQQFKTSPAFPATPSSSTASPHESYIDLPLLHPPHFH